MLPRIFVFVCAASLALGRPANEPKVQKLTFGSGGVNRTYYLYIPEKAAPGPLPLLLLLHGQAASPGAHSPSRSVPLRVLPLSRPLREIVATMAA